MRNVLGMVVMNGCDEGYHLVPAMAAIQDDMEYRHPGKSYEITKPEKIGDEKYKIMALEL